LTDAQPIPASSSTIPPQIDQDVLAEGVAYLHSTGGRLAELIDAVGPCTLQLHDDLFVALINAIIAQQISTKAKEKIVGRLMALYEPLPHPTAHQLLTTPDEQLRAVGCSGAKVTYLKDLSARIVDGRLDLTRLPSLPDEEVIAALVGVKGIGRWTAEMLLIFALGRLDVWPVDDLGVVVGVQRLLELPERPKPKELNIIGDQWRPYRTLVSWYCWRMPRAMFTESPTNHS
jgi:DNA-3-methyladenine glycosylase II